MTVTTPRRARLRLVLWAAVIVIAAWGFRSHSNELSELHRQGRHIAAQQTRQDETDAALRAGVRRLAAVNDSGTHGSCVKRNNLRNGIIRFVAQSRNRSALATRATLASPVSTAEQKKVALINLAGIEYALAGLKKAIPLEPC